MFCKYQYNGMVLEFVVNDKNDVYLLNMCLEKNRKDIYTDLPSPFSVILSGEYRGGMHGSSLSGPTSDFTFKYHSHDSYENDDGLVVKMSASDGKVIAEATYVLCKDIKAIKSFVNVTNISDEDVGLEHVASLRLKLADLYQSQQNDHLSVNVPYNVWRQEANWKTYKMSDIGFEKYSNGSTKRFAVSNTGRWSTKSYLPMGAFENSETKETFLWQIESNGSWAWELTDSNGAFCLVATGPEEHDHSWHKELKKGESFESVHCSITLGESFDECLEYLTKYRRVVVGDRGSDKVNPVIFNDFMRCIIVNPTAEKMYPVIDKAAELGCEYYVMDAGWYTTPEISWFDGVGEWKADSQRFPEGLRKVFDYIKSKGMRPGIWLEIEVMGINSPAVKELDDDCFFKRHGRRVVDARRYQLDFRNPKVIDYVTKVVDRVVNEYGAEYIKFDYNIECGVGTEVNSDSFGDGLMEHCRAVTAWKKSIRKKYPDIIIENCSSGGMKMDYNSLSASQLQSVSDQEEYFNNAILASIIPTAILPEQAAMWCPPIAEESENIVIMSVISAMMLRFYQAGEVTALCEKAIERIKEGIALYKQIRSDINEAIPFYPLGITKFGDKYFCTGYRCSDKTYLCVWHLDGEEDEKFIPLENATSAKILYPSYCSYGKVRLSDGGIKVATSENTALFIEIR